MMGNCLKFIKFRRVKRPVTLLLVGLDNAGKTTAAKGLVGDSVENVAPTVGFCPETLVYRGCQITIYDLGGGSRIRGVWSKYFSEIHGIIFVIDSSDQLRIEECQSVLRDLLCHPKVSGKPLLILANKQDIEGALDEIDLVESMKIEEVVNTYRCPARVETCSANNIRKRKPEKAIAEGFRWLVDSIVANYAALNKRVVTDTEMERRKEKEEADRRRERLKAAREVQERRAELARMTLERKEDDKEDLDEEIIVIEEEITEDDRIIQVVPALNHVANGVIFETHDSPVEERSQLTWTEAHELTWTEAHELRELGLTEANLTHASSTSSSSLTLSVSGATLQGSSSPSGGGSIGRTSPQLVVIHTRDNNVHELPEEENKMASSSSLLNVALPDDVISPYTESKSFRRGSFSNECIPMDSDDEADKSSLPHMSNGSLTAGVKEQLELEASLHGKPKKKPILKRLNKTAPLDIPADHTFSRNP